MDDLTLMMVILVIVLAAIVAVLAVLLMRKKQPAQAYPPAQLPVVPSQPYAPPPAPQQPTPPAFPSPSQGQPAPSVQPVPSPAPPQPARPAAEPAAPAPAEAPRTAGETPPAFSPVPPDYPPSTPSAAPLAPSSAPSPAPTAPAPPSSPAAPSAYPSAPSSPPFESSRTSYFGQAARPEAPPAPAKPRIVQAQAAAFPAPAAAPPQPRPAAPPGPGPAFPVPAVPPSGDMRHFTKKIILIGDGGVGKTTLIRKFVYDMFDDKYIQTIGTKVSKKKMAFPDRNLDVNLMVWDVQGQRNDPLLTRYFSGAEGALFVCDLTRFSTFENLSEWIKDFQAMCGVVPMILLGNKADLLDAAQFGESELSALAARYGAKSYLTSAKTGVNVEKSFNELAQAIIA